MTEITDPHHIITRDMQRRATELHERWFIEVIDLCNAAELSLDLSLGIVAATMALGAARAVALADTDADKAGRVFAAMIKAARKEFQQRKKQREAQQ